MPCHYASAEAWYSIEVGEKTEDASGERLVAGYLSIEYASLTDVGVRRSHNQDAHVVLAAGDAAQFNQRGHVFVVADGMGAHAVGELASKIAIDNIPHIYLKHVQEGPAGALHRS